MDTGTLYTAVQILSITEKEKWTEAESRGGYQNKQLSMSPHAARPWGRVKRQFQHTVQTRFLLVTEHIFKHSRRQALKRAPGVACLGAGTQDHV